MKKQLLILMTLFMSVMAYSQVFTVNHITYLVTSTTSNTVKAFSYDTAGGTSVIIPDTVDDNSITYSVTGIHQMAFMNKNLTSVDLPNGLTSIELFAFANNQISSIVIPDGVTSIEIAAFENNQLTSANIPASLTIIGDQIFRNNQLSNIVIPDGVTSIGQSAFNNNLFTNVIIPNSVTNISSYAFSSNPLTDVTSEAVLPPTITTGGAGDSFGTSRSTIDLTIPTGTTAAYITDPGALWTGFNSATEIGALTVGDTFVNNFITYEITSLSPDQVEAVDYDTTGGTVVSIPATVTDNAIPYSVVGIGNSAFYNNNLSAINLPNSLESIGDDAFRLNQISTLTITPNTVTSIGERAFRSNQLTSLVVPNGVTFLGSEAFAQNLLTSADIADSVTTIEGFLFWQNSFTDLSNVVFPFGTTNIPEGCFYENPFITVVIPDGILSIGDVAFEENQITSVTLPSSLISIGDQAFKDNQITSITIPNGVVSIGDSAFMINQLGSLDIPDSVTNVGNSAFKQNVLSSVIIGNGITSISELCFQQNQLTNVSMSDSVTIIQDGAFENNLLTNITIPVNVTNIEGNAFIGNPLTSVTSENTTPPGVVTGSEDSFATNRGTIDLIIPTGTTNDYLANGWTGFNSVTEAVLSISDFDLVSDVKVITTFDEIRIVVSDNLQFKNYTIYNISGAKVVSGTDSKLSSSFLSDGIHILQLEFDKGSVIKKIVIN